jgi:hypothetical protein
MEKSNYSIFKNETYFPKHKGNGPPQIHDEVAEMKNAQADMSIIASLTRGDVKTRATAPSSRILDLASSKKQLDQTDDNTIRNNKIKSLLSEISAGKDKNTDIDLVKAAPPIITKKAMEDRKKAIEDKMSVKYSIIGCKSVVPIYEGSSTPTNPTDE